MIVIPRGLCRAFPALTRKCVSGRPRGPAPVVVCEARAGRLTVWTRTTDAVLVHAAPTDCADRVLVLPMGVLEAAAGPGDDPVELAAGPKLKGEARWADRGVPQAHPFEAVRPGRQHRPPDPPITWEPVPVEFLTALHECGRTAARDAGRYALTRVQVDGAAGRVTGTDGHTALLWAGFALPFADAPLVPAVPAFGAKELAAGDPPVRVGRTADHLVVESGPWRVFLPVDAAGRFPDIGSVIPIHPPSAADLHPADTAELVRRLAGLPGADADGRPVTVALDGRAAVLGRDETTGRVERVRLGRSPAAGPPARAAIDRRVLARALALECHTVRLAAGKPVVFAGGARTLVTAAFDPALAVTPDTAVAADAVRSTNTERSTAVRHETNGHPPNGRPDPPAADPPDPLAAAEELRAALADALTKAGRLVAALKGRKKEQRALTQVWSSLKALHLGPGGTP